MAERGLRRDQSDRGDQRLRVDEPAQQNDRLAERNDRTLVDRREQLGLGCLAQIWRPARGKKNAGNRTNMLADGGVPERQS